VNLLKLGSTLIIVLPWVGMSKQFQEIKYTIFKLFIIEFCLFFK